MNKLIKTFLLFCLCSSFGLNAFSQYNQNTNVFKRKKSPAATSTSNTKSGPSQDIYKNKKVDIAINEEQEAMDIIKRDPQNNPGHTLNSDKPSYTPSTNRRQQASTPNQQTSRTSSQQVQRKSSTAHPFKTKRPKTGQASQNTKSGAYINTKSLNFDALNEGGKATTTTKNNFTPPSQRRSTSYYSGHYNNSVKVYNQRGERVSASYSNVNRSVIIVPKQGLTVTGIVTSDDPGRSITIKDNQQKSMTYQYTDMDALVNI